jgi:hypothetical protein
MSQCCSIASTSSSLIKGLHTSFRLRPIARASRQRLAKSLSSIVLDSKRCPVVPEAVGAVLLCAAAAAACCWRRGREEKLVAGALGSAGRGPSQAAAATVVGAAAPWLDGSNSSMKSCVSWAWASERRICAVLDFDGQVDSVCAMWAFMWSGDKLSVTPGRYHVPHHAN